MLSSLQQPVKEIQAMSPPQCFSAVAQGEISASLSQNKEDVVNTLNIFTYLTEGTEI